MFDEDLPKPKASSIFPRNLEDMSVDEVQEYIAEMRAEITRAETDIAQKQASMSAADSFFKS